MISRNPLVHIKNPATSTGVFEVAVVPSVVAAVYDRRAFSSEVAVDFRATVGADLRSFKCTREGIKP